LELAETVLELTGSRSPLIRKPLPLDDPRLRRPDISLAEAELGWQPSVVLREGLTKTIAYFDDFLRSKEVHVPVDQITDPPLALH
jgi:UDP-glucuronate decarboxylase